MENTRIESGFYLHVKRVQSTIQFALEKKIRTAVNFRFKVTNLVVSWACVKFSAVSFLKFVVKYVENIEFIHLQPVLQPFLMLISMLYFRCFSQSKLWISMNFIKWKMNNT
jgi:hypothetical protein